ncbi:MAG TPA: hypothetical protein VLI04_03525, partial [Nocardioidaceae bacterium]|nr:hypothetical protein [Nocardioidaceae bacterium]
MRTRVVAWAVTAVVAVSGAGVDTRAAAAPIFPTLGSDAYDVLHYDLDLRWEEAGGYLEGTATQALLTLRARSAATSLSLDLDSNLQVTAVSVDAVPKTFSQSGHKLVVQSTLVPGAEYAVKVAYGGTPRALTDPDGSATGWLTTFSGGALVLSEPRGSMTWFPNNNRPGDKATFDISVNVPADFQAISNGRNTSVQTVAGRSVWNWAVNEPMATYLATVGIGQYNRTTRVVDGIRYDSFTEISQN